MCYANTEQFGNGVMVKTEPVKLLKKPSKFKNTSPANTKQ